MACIYRGQDGQEGGIGCEVLRCRRKRGACANCEFLIGRFGGEKGEQRRGWVYGMFVDVLCCVSLDSAIGIMEEESGRPTMCGLSGSVEIFLEPRKNSVGAPKPGRMLRAARANVLVSILNC